MASRFLFMMSIVSKNAFRCASLVCSIFWAWGGFAGQNPDHVFWEKGDDYTGDPAQEQQGLNSVFATDSTIEIIKAENRKLQN